MKPFRPRPFRPGPRPFRGPRPFAEGDPAAEERPRGPRPSPQEDGGYEPRPRPARPYAEEGPGYGGRPYRPRPYADPGYEGRPYEERSAPYRPRYERPRREYDQPRRPVDPVEAKPRPPQPDPKLEARLKQVKWFLCDVDGVLTDASVFVGSAEEVKRFSVRDGFGLRLLQRQGIKVGWVSHRASVATTRRAEELQVDFLHQEPGSKVAVIETLLAQNSLTWEDVCFMGDDLVDLGVLKRAGFAVTVSNSLPEVKALAHYVAKASAGYGAVREVAEMLLKAQGKWAALVEEYSA